MLGPVVLALLAALALGLPIYIALGGISTLLLLFHGAPPVGVAQLIVDKLNSSTITAVPFFVVAAQFMERGGIAQALIRMSEAWIGHVRGGLALACVGATTVFAAVSGSSVATALAMATILVPAMLARNYSRSFAVGVVGSSGTLGILIPPSIVLVIYGIIAEASIPRLFLAGIVPGLLQAALFSTFILFFAYRTKLPATERVSASELLRANLAALPAIVIPLMIFVGIYGGYTTIAEAAALAAFLAGAVSLTVYRGCTLKDVIPIFGDSMRRSAAIILIVAAAMLFGHWLTETGIPADVVEFVRDINLTGWQFLLLINVVMLVLGTVLEGISIILITVPLVMPLLEQFGIDPVHYAIIVVINIELAMLTPPIGLNLYVLSGVSGAPVTEVIRGVLPFVLLMLVLLMVVTYIPWLSLALPDYVFN